MPRTAEAICWQYFAFRSPGLPCLCCLLLVGCATLQRDPVAQNVVQSRQLSLRGMDAVQQGHWLEAERLFRESIELCSADERSHRRYAELLWRRGAWEEAIHHMQTAVELSGGDGMLLIQLGEMYLARGDVARARARAEEAISAQPQAAEAWALQGDVLFRQGHAMEAMMSYHRSLAERPHYPHVQLSLSQLYLQQNRPRRALATLDSLAAALPPDSVPRQLRQLQGIALKRLKRYDAAVVVLAGAAEDGVPTADLLSELAEAQWLAGDLVNAQLALQAALAQAPEHQQARQLQQRIASARSGRPAR